MIKDFLKSVPFTTIIITFFFICGGLYLIGFWSTFDIDISNIVNFTDIPKSFIFPFVISNGMSVLNLLSSLFYARHDKERTELEKPPEKKSKFRLVVSLLFSSDALMSYGIGFILSYYSKYGSTSQYWLLSGFFISILIALNISNLPSVKKIMPTYPTLRFYLVSAMVYTPIMSFAIGKANSLNIYTNSDIKYIKTIPKNANNNMSEMSDTVSFKLLGFLGDKLIISTLDNKKITILNQSEFPKVEIWKKAKK